MYLDESASLMILKESCKSDKKHNSYECDNVCDEFEDTMRGLDSVELSYTIDSIPICKVGTECGGNECGSQCESYLVDFTMLSNICESYDDINNELEAHSAICSYYGFNESDLAVVFQSDGVSKEIIEEAKSTKKCGLARNCNDSIKGFKNKGIKVFKKKTSNKKKRK